MRCSLILRGGAEKDDVHYLLADKSAGSSYDYNRESRNLNYQSIDNNKNYSEAEKQKLKSAIDFLQAEYDRVVKNMIDLVYDGNQSVEFFRNVPINELWKYSNGKYDRLDFLIKEAKF